MKRFILALLILASITSQKNASAQTLTSIYPDSIPLGDYTTINVLGNLTDFYSFTNAYLVKGSDTIHNSYQYVYDGQTMDIEFDPTCAFSIGWYDLHVFTVTDGDIVLPNAVYVKEADFGLWLDAQNPRCHNDTNGYIYVNYGNPLATNTSESENNITRGGPMYFYNWNTGDTTYYLSDLGAGTYWCIVTHQFTGCIDSIGIEFINPPVLNLYYTEIDSDCGANNGIAYVDSITGGMAPYSIFWGPSEDSNDTIYNLTLGTGYSISIEDSLGCYIDDYFSITERISMSVTSVNTLCGDPSGSATITILNGTGPYNILWSNGDTGLTADSLVPGIYHVTVSDGTGCSGTESITITGTDGPTLTSVVTGSPSCSGLTDGSIDITVSGGTAPYTFLWSNGSTTEDLTNVPAGIYEINVMDTTGCFVAQCISIAENNELNAYLNYDYRPYCFNSDGALEVFGSGGVQPISITWSANAGGQTTNYIWGLVPGIYTAYLTDALGCTDSLVVTLPNADGPYAQYDSVYTADCGVGNGAFFTTIYGGYGAPYTTTWSNGQTSEDLLNVEPGMYILTVYDQIGCVGYTQEYVWGNASNGQDICIVTVDSATGSNLVVWEKPVVTDIDYYNIYREACGDVEGFVWVGSVDYDSLSQFVDYGANAMVKSWRYLMTTVNNCGAESDVSPIHKTIHLSATRQASNNVVVTWDDYSGFGYPEQYLWRYHSSTNWIIIDTIPFGTNLFVDTSSLAVDSVQYFIEAYPSYTCTSTRAENHNSTRSNRGTLAPPNSSDVDENIEFVSSINVYPNPSNGLFNLNFRVKEAGTSNLQVFDLAGRIVVDQTLNVASGFNNYTLNMNGVSNGIYYVRIQLGTIQYHAKIIKN